jgi:hypothetical protein
LLGFLALPAQIYDAAQRFRRRGRLWLLFGIAFAASRPASGSLRSRGCISLRGLRSINILQEMEMKPSRPYFDQTAYQLPDV